MVTVVDSLLAKALHHAYRHSRDQFSLLVHISEVTSSCNLVHSLESRQNQLVPLIVYAPILLQSVGDGSIHGNHVLRCALLLIIVAHNPRQKREDIATHISRIVQLACNECIRNILHHQLFSLCLVRCIQLCHQPFIGINVKNFYRSIAPTIYYCAMM